MKLRHAWIVLACAALLSACGGGDDDSGTSPFIPPTDEFAVLAGWQNLLTVGGTWELSGVGSDGASYEATIKIAPAAAAVFPPSGESFARTTVLASVSRNGVLDSASTLEYFRDVDLRVQAARRTIEGTVTCAQTTASALPLTVAKIPASGPLATMDNLSPCVLGGVVDGTTTITWSLEFERGIVLLCLNSEAVDLLTGQATGRESDCIQIATDGTLGSRARVTIVVSGLTLVMKNF
jgi:hypothetical protein